MTKKLIEMAPNGRLVIPHDTRTELGLKGPGQFMAYIADGSIVLTPVAIVPVDHGFPITPELVASADRAAAETGPGLSRDNLHELVAAKRKAAPSSK